MLSVKVVFNGSKILIRKQITTINHVVSHIRGCFQWFKDTNSKANHNQILLFREQIPVVFNGSKILIRKQITTLIPRLVNRNELFSMVQRY